MSAELERSFVTSMASWIGLAFEDRAPLAAMLAEFHRLSVKAERERVLDEFEKLARALDASADSGESAYPEHDWLAAEIITQHIAKLRSETP